MKKKQYIYNSKPQISREVLNKLSKYPILKPPIQEPIDVSTELIKADENISIGGIMDEKVEENEDKKEERKPENNQKITLGFVVFIIAVVCVICWIFKKIKL